MQSTKEIYYKYNTDMAKKSYWFKRKRYGWGWTPVTWQGWISIIVPLVVILVVPFLIFPEKPEQPTAVEILIFLITIAGSVSWLVLIGKLKGPSPRFRWGNSTDDDPEEDI